MIYGRGPPSHLLKAAPMLIVVDATAMTERSLTWQDMKQETAFSEHLARSKMAGLTHKGIPLANPAAISSTVSRHQPGIIPWEVDRLTGQSINYPRRYLSLAGLITVHPEKRQGSEVGSMQNPLPSGLFDHNVLASTGNH